MPRPRRTTVPAAVPNTLHGRRLLRFSHRTATLDRPGAPPCPDPRPSARRQHLPSAPPAEATRSRPRPHRHLRTCRPPVPCNTISIRRRLAILHGPTATHMRLAPVRAPLIFHHLLFRHRPNSSSLPALCHPAPMAWSAHTCMVLRRHRHRPSALLAALLQLLAARLHRRTCTRDRTRRTRCHPPRPPICTTTWQFTPREAPWRRPTCLQSILRGRSRSRRRRLDRRSRPASASPQALEREPSHSPPPLTSSACHPLRAPTTTHSSSSKLKLHRPHRRDQPLFPSACRALRVRTRATLAKPIRDRCHRPIVSAVLASALKPEFRASRAAPATRPWAASKLNRASHKDPVRAPE